MSTTPGLPEALQQLRSLWWVFMLFGLLALAAGIVVLVWPDISLATLAVIVGIFLLIDGIFGVIGSIAADKGEPGRGLLAIVGVLGIIAGVVLVKHPFSAVTVFVLILGAWLVVAGVVRLLTAISDREDRGTNLAVGLLDIVAGIVILAWPEIGIATLAIFAGIVFILRGLVFIWGGWQLHKLPKDGNLGGGAPAAA